MGECRHVAMTEHRTAGQGWRCPKSVGQDPLPGLEKIVIFIKRSSITDTLPGQGFDVDGW